MNNFKYTEHSKKRARQRGIKNEIIDLIYKEADKKIKKMGNARALYISKSRINELHKLCLYKRDIIDKSKNIFLLISNEGNLLTVVRTKKPIYRRNIKYSLIS